MSDRAKTVVDTLIRLDPLAQLPRTGWAMRGVVPCESIADHSHGVALCTLLLVDALRAEGLEVDGEAALRMAVVHDAPEAAIGDVPMPMKTPGLDAALTEVETRLAERLMPDKLAEDWKRMEAGESLEARVVKAADKIHMITKALLYERRGWRNLDDFFENPKNFDDRGLPVVEEIFALLRAMRA